MAMKERRRPSKVVLWKRRHFGTPKMCGYRWFGARLHHSHHFGRFDVPRSVIRYCVPPCVPVTEETKRYAEKLADRLRAEGRMP